MIQTQLSQQNNPKDGEHCKILGWDDQKIFEGVGKEEDDNLECLGEFSSYRKQGIQQENYISLIQVKQQEKILKTCQNQSKQADEIKIKNKIEAVSKIVSIFSLIIQKFKTSFFIAISSMKKERRQFKEYNSLMKKYYPVSSKGQLCKITQNDEQNQQFEENDYNLSSKNGIIFKKDEPILLKPCKNMKILFGKMKNGLMDKHELSMGKSLKIFTQIQENSQQKINFAQQSVPINAIPLNKLQELEEDITQNFKDQQFMDSVSMISLNQSKISNEPVQQLKCQRSNICKYEKPVNFGNQTVFFKNLLIKQRSSFKDIHKVNQQRLVQLKQQNSYINDTNSKRIYLKSNKNTTEISNQIQNQQILEGEVKINNKKQTFLKIVRKNTMKSKEHQQCQIAPYFLLDNQFSEAKQYFAKEIKQSNASTNHNTMSIFTEQTSNQDQCTLFQKKQSQRQFKEFSIQNNCLGNKNPITPKFIRHLSHSQSLASDRQTFDLELNKPKQNFQQFTMTQEKKKNSFGPQYEPTYGKELSDNLSMIEMSSRKVKRIHRGIEKSNSSFIKPYQWKNLLIKKRQSQILVSCLQKPLQASSIVYWNPTHINY